MLVHTRVCVHVCMHVGARVSVRERALACMSACTCIHACILCTLHVHMSVHVCAHVCMCVTEIKEDALRWTQAGLGLGPGQGAECHSLQGGCAPPKGHSAQGQRTAYWRPGEPLPQTTSVPGGPPSCCPARRLHRVAPRGDRLPLASPVPSQIPFSTDTAEALASPACEAA